MVEAARAVEGDAWSRDLSSQPRAGRRRGSTGDLLSLHHLVPTREGIKSHGQAWAQRGLQLVSQWARGKMPFPLCSPLKGAALIEGGGCPSWCCLKRSLRCRARH